MLQPVSGAAATANGSRPKYEPVPAPSELKLPRAPLPGAPPALAVRAVVGLRRALQRLTDAVCPAELAAFDHVTGIGKTMVLGAVAKHRIPDLIGDGAFTAEELAEKAGLHADALHRTLRALATLGFFKLRADGRFQNTRLSRALGSGRLSRIREFAMYYAFGSSAASWVDFPKTLQSGRAAFDRLHGMTVWDWYELHPDERELFAHVMMGITMQHAPVIAAIYPWKGVTRVCDVGGGRGSLLSELLVRHPHLRGVLCDADGVLASAKRLLEERGVMGRADLVPGNFFDEVPAGCDAYVLKNVLHDWDDDSAMTILRVVREAAGQGAKLLVCESLVEKGSRDPMGTIADLHMMNLCSNGRERGKAEIRALMEASGFRFEKAYEYPTIAVLEGAAI